MGWIEKELCHRLPCTGSLPQHIHKKHQQNPAHPQHLHHHLLHLQQNRRQPRRPRSSTVRWNCSRTGMCFCPEPTSLPSNKPILFCAAFGHTAFVASGTNLNVPFFIFTVSGVRNTADRDPPLLMLKLATLTPLSPSTQSQRPSSTPVSPPPRAITSPATTFRLLHPGL